MKIYYDLTYQETRYENDNSISRQVIIRQDADVFGDDREHVYLAIGKDESVNFSKLLRQTVMKLTGKTPKTLDFYHDNYRNQFYKGNTYTEVTFRVGTS